MISYSTWIPVIMQLSEPIECTAPRVNPHINYELWMIIMYPCKSINFNESTTLVEDMNNGKGCANVKEQDMYFLLDFAANLKLL